MIDLDLPPLFTNLVREEVLFANVVEDATHNLFLDNDKIQPATTGNKKSSPTKSV